MRGARVFDSWALLAFFQNRGSAGEEVEKILSAAVARGRNLYLHSVSWTEIYATLENTAGMEAAAHTAGLLAQLPVETVGIDNLELCRLAAWHKTAYELTLAGSFAAALAQTKRAQLVTGDPQFLRLLPDIKIHWLGDPELVAHYSSV